MEADPRDSAYRYRFEFSLEEVEEICSALGFAENESYYQNGDVLRRLGGRFELFLESIPRP